jgi:hypothetical protein
MNIRRGVYIDSSAVKQMSELVAQVKDEQSYIVVRERTHRNTAESTNARIKWWSIFQLAVLIGQGFFQVWWLKRFFEVSRGGLHMLRRAWTLMRTCRSNASYDLIAFLSSLSCILAGLVISAFSAYHGSGMVKDGVWR